jgi:hypothetical protein
MGVAGIGGHWPPLANGGGRVPPLGAVEATPKILWSLGVAACHSQRRQPPLCFIYLFIIIIFIKIYIYIVMDTCWLSIWCDVSD